MTKILKCTCVNEYQDRVYGKDNRVMNERGKDGAKNGYRCTVCGREQAAGAALKLTAQPAKKQKDEESRKEKKGK